MAIPMEAKRQNVHFNLKIIFRLVNKTIHPPLFWLLAKWVGETPDSCRVWSTYGTTLH
jgi:hypothetical protein